MTDLPFARHAVTHPATGPFDALPLPPAAPEPLSRDLPSHAPIRPFGLTRCAPLPGRPIDHHLDHLRYDHEHQISRTADGIPVIEQEHIVRAATPCDTRYDNQWFTDKDD